MFADDLAIWCSNSSLRNIESNLQRSINKISSFCDQWGLLLNKKKTFLTVFCSAGVRTNYYRKYYINLRLKETIIPLEPYPTFLGITLDPKLSFKKHLESIELKIASKVNLFKKIKSLRINHININIILFKSLIRSILDYAFIALSCPTQRIMSDLQKIQNRMLRSIRYFPPLTRIIDIHAYFQNKLLENRTSDLLKKFTIAKLTHDLISKELAFFEDYIQPTNRKLVTTYDLMLKFI